VAAGLGFRRTGVSVLRRDKIDRGELAGMPAAEPALLRAAEAE
jgi:hypothetical protein